MEHLLYLPAYEGVLQEYDSPEDLIDFYTRLGCQGLEIIDCNDDPRSIVRPDAIVGLHLTFQACWLDFWRGDLDAVLAEFGSTQVVEEFFGSLEPMSLVRQYRKELDLAEAMGVKYVVFHVSEVSIDGVFTHQHRHEDIAVVDGAAEIINRILSGREEKFDFLMENLWWPGLNLKDPATTRRLLDQVEYSRKGLMVDVGHLLHTNLDLTTEQEACSYVHRILDHHEDMIPYMKGVHLHQTLSGQLVKDTIKSPPTLAEGYYNRFAQVYDHIGKVDSHLPFTDPGITGLIDRIDPHYLVHELMVKDRKHREEALIQQRGLFL